jgi:hypothetical protein
MPSRKTYRRRRMTGGGFFDTIKNGFRRVFTSSEPAAAPTAPPPPVPAPAPAPVPAPAPAPVPVPAQPMTINRRQRNIFPPPANSKIPMIGGRSRHRRSHKRRRTHKRH